MSAAEKLRALDEAMTPGTWGIFVPVRNPEHAAAGYTTEVPTDHWGYYLDENDEKGVAVLRNALPEIIAVVEAAEELLYAWGNTLDRASMMEEGDRLIDALAVLKEKLSQP